MKMSKIIYSINVEDVQNVAEKEMGRSLTDRELKVVEDKLGDRIDWYEAILDTITSHIGHRPRKKI